ncbi:hypothetical protein GALL_493450 [mine drainage metagenome]|uniref:Uncharacterized protein n=1 Tax=mine drainage metagenome TaxID=410659 RepID=A0A1J5PMR7_9ZZZZ
MLVEQIDAIGTQTFKGLLYDQTYAFGAAVESSNRFAVLESELGGNDHLIAERLDSLAHQFLVELAIGFGRIEKRDAALYRRPNESDPFRLLCGRAVVEAQAHAA